MNRKRWIWSAVSIIILIAIWNWPLGYRVGVGGVLSEKKIPFYAKACGYLYRDWMYKDIVRDLAIDKKDDNDKILAILRWTRENIRSGIPKGLKVVDDHPLNIIIRQYGSGDQLNDVFTILCSYAGMKAGIVKCYNPEKTRFVYISLVRSNSRWLIFDVAGNKYFLNKDGAIASVDDYSKGDLVMPEKDAAYYNEFLPGLKDVDVLNMTRADEQMPLRRIPAEFRKILKGKKGQ